MKYEVLTKQVGGEAYRKVKQFNDYKRAYYYIGDLLQKKDTLHWSYSVKYLMDGYDRKKIFPYGKLFLRRKNICFKINTIN
jgi:hypothetical protein